MPATELDQFVALSQVLTGQRQLDQTRAEQYLQRLKNKYSAQMQDLLSAFGKIPPDTNVVFEVKRRIVDNAGLLPLAQQIIGIWFTAEFVGPDGKGDAGTQDQYYHGLIWDVILAHAPTDSHQEYGYWATPPRIEQVKKTGGYDHGQ